MKTPIADFIKNYIQMDYSRFHMPGHKGKRILGVEEYDITEISGADVLSTADGIIQESENNASLIFDTGHSFYVTQGSTTAICAMLALIKKNDERTFVLATRNVHKAFVHACALLDLDVGWLMPEHNSCILRCEVTGDLVEQQILKSGKKPAAVYVTSPDYLGHIQNISEISEVCRRYGIVLLVDNAHGAYLKFLGKHPIELGATACCDSAHKTLPVLTGGAYLHISKSAPESFTQNARDKIALFSSTSPSYLILQSMDMCNLYLYKDYKKEIFDCIKRIDAVKAYIKSKGFCVISSEPLKIVIDAYSSGYSGNELFSELRKFGIESEFCDNDYVVLMVTPQNNERDFKRIENAFSKLEPTKCGFRKSIAIPEPIIEMSIREAVLASSEVLDIGLCENRICAAPTVSCPPAVPVAVSGERITGEIIDIFKYYGIEKIRVVK